MTVAAAHVKPTKKKTNVKQTSALKSWCLLARKDPLHLGFCYAQINEWLARSITCKRQAVFYRFHLFFLILPTIAEPVLSGKDKTELVAKLSKPSLVVHATAVTAPRYARTPCCGCSSRCHEILNIFVIDELHSDCTQMRKPRVQG